MPAQIVHQTDYEENWRIQEEAAQRENSALLVENGVQGDSIEKACSAILDEILEILIVVVDIEDDGLEGSYAERCGNH